MKDRDNNPLVPGALYCAITLLVDGTRELGCLYWYSSDGDFYIDNGIRHEPDLQPSYPDFDELVRQIGSFDPGFAEPINTEVALQTLDRGAL